MLCRHGSFINYGTREEEGGGKMREGSRATRGRNELKVHDKNSNVAEGAKGEEVGEVTCDGIYE